jgi:hypothetical protein
MKTHTPGPWHYETGDDGAVVYTGFTIAKIPIDGSNWQSNAHLIAAAPDLLATLEAALTAVEYYHEHEGCDAMINQVRDAIAKAKAQIED